MSEVPGVVIDEEARTKDLVDPNRLGRGMDEHDLPGRGEAVETRFISGGASNGQIVLTMAAKAAELARTTALR